MMIIERCGGKGDFERKGRQQKWLLFQGVYEIQVQQLRDYTSGSISDMDMNTAVVDFGSDCCFAQDSLSFTNTKVFRCTSTLLNTTEYDIDDPGNNRIFQTLHTLLKA